MYKIILDLSIKCNHLEEKMEHVQLLYEVSALSGDKEVKNLKKTLKKQSNNPSGNHWKTRTDYGSNFETHSRLPKDKARKKNR